jgi:tRNA(adenine34) deaminase
MMWRALDLAQKALEAGEFPVGCVIAHGDRVVATGARECSMGATPNEIDHAEMVALRRLSQTGHGGETGLTLYCTMEPCLMCFGAIVLSGIHNIVFAYEDVMGGGTTVDRRHMSPLYRDPTLIILPHVLRQESVALFKAFFSDPSNGYWRGSLLARYTLEQAVPTERT